MCLDNLKINQRSYYNLPYSAFWGWLSTESQPQNPEFRINPENFHPWVYVHYRPASETPFEWVDSGPPLDVYWNWFDLPMHYKIYVKVVIKFPVLGIVILQINTIVRTTLLKRSL